MLKSDTKKSSKNNLSFKLWILILAAQVFIGFIFSTVINVRIDKKIHDLGCTSINKTQNVNINTEELAEKIDINTATKEELKSLPGIGDKIADSIIASRPFNSIHDLKLVNGIGDNLYNSISKGVMIK